jgi:hypothetical protein
MNARHAEAELYMSDAEEADFWAQLIPTPPNTPVKKDLPDFYPVVSLAQSEKSKQVWTSNIGTKNVLTMPLRRLQECIRKLLY